MAEREIGWRWFEETDPPSAFAHSRETEKCFARCFRGTDGDAVIAHLRAMTADRVLGPETGDRELRHLEGQRFLVAQICALIARGRNEKEDGVINSVR